jgi:hypothetical protein
VVLDGVSDFPRASLSAPASDSLCTFKFNLQDYQQQPTQEEQQPLNLWNNFVKHAQNMPHCVSLKKNNDYWRYDLCPSQHIIQAHNDEKYILGKFKAADNLKNELIFEDGQICDALQHKPARKTRVKVFCDEDAAEVRIIHIEETQMCSYTMYIATKMVCGDERFQRAQEKFPNYAEQGVVLQEDDSTSFEEWHLYLDQTNNGELFCEAFLHGSSNNLKFKRAELTLSNKRFPFSLESCSLRAKGNFGELIPHNAFTISVGTEKINLLSTPSFEGTLSYVGLHCKSPNKL